MSSTSSTSNSNAVVPAVSAPIAIAAEREAQRIHQRKRISASQIRLSESLPFFGALLMMAPIVMSDSIPTAATNGRELLFNATFVHTLNANELDGVIVHELLHLALLHVPRRGLRDHMIWNIAADIHINGIIASTRQLQLPAGAIEDFGLASLCVEEIYEKLLHDGNSASKDRVTLRRQGYKLDVCDVVELPDDGRNSHESMGSSELSARLVNEWSANMSCALAMTGEQHHGSLPDAILRSVRETNAPQINWQSVLWRSVVRTPDDFAGFDRRHLWRGLYMEALESETVDIDVCIDTSGSVSNVQLSEFLGVLRNIVSSYATVRCRLHYADTQCVGPFEVYIDRPLAAAIGGGGTDFRPFFAAVAAQGAADGASSNASPTVIYITDGYGTFPQTAPDLEVLWVVTSGGKLSKDFPFGTVLRMGGRS
jgi:predicted metal-dependent peptidase